MYAIRGSFIAKVLSILLLTAFVLVFFVAILGEMYVASAPDTVVVENYFRSHRCRDLLTNAACNIEIRLGNGMQLDDLRDTWISDQNGWLGEVDYQLLNARGELLSQSHNAADIATAGHIHTRTVGDMTIKTYVDRNIEYSCRGMGLNKLMFDFCHGFSGYFATALLISGVGAGAALLFLCFAAGHKKGREGIEANSIDKIPYDILAVGIFSLLGISVAMISELSYGFQRETAMVLVALVIVMDYAFALSFVLTTITRIKQGTLFTNTIIWRICGKGAVWLWQKFRQLCRKLMLLPGKLQGIFSNLPMIGKGAAVIVGAAAVNTALGLYLMVYGVYNSIPLLLFLIIEAGAVVVCWKIMLDMDKLKKAGRYLAEGDTEFTVDTEKMLWDFRKHGDNLNSIGQGIARAVDRQMRSERLKTELITNVSHDIKTPLTSIVNYVDLLKKEKLEGKACEYVEVLDRQSARLKKLTEDLVEASKASSGNISISLSPTDVGEIARQSAGEYSERLASAKLELVLGMPEPAPKIMADGRLLWRIIDNLLSNVCKYSQPGTRVYLDVRRIGGKVSISMKNISRDMLNIDPDELTERFVRGDLSRSTEGSGLGLNIARSLTELQNGTFSLTVDGDLFKAELQFNEIG